MAVMAVGRAIVPHKILRLCPPRPQEFLSDPQQLGPGYSFDVRGTLKKVPKGHQIWVMTQGDVKGRFWPQGLSCAVCPCTGDLVRQSARIWKSRCSRGCCCCAAILSGLFRVLPEAWSAQEQRFRAARAGSALVHQLR